ncbi:MAG: CHRD domain-containing protein [Gammaproteobacteria bacterium]|nr:CHRD domain-containing protein [Gammaproteobacteria bacterium]
MNKNLFVLLLCLYFFLIPAQAEIVNLNSNMDCAQANAGAGTCGVGGTGTGVGTMTFDTVTNVLSWNVSHSGLSSAVTATHFHGPAQPDQNAGVQVG